MKRLGILLATAALTVSASASAFAYHSYSSYDVRNNDRSICDNYVCDDYYSVYGENCEDNYGVYGENCEDNYGACYGNYGYRSGSYRINGICHSCR
ncbi:hypothetical protein SAMN05216349_1783 [Oribacterium sp. KHPX15]|uniref:hypothetical protein n=1 Tax=Oribacterium sp. KHPX15 TaxID=1855342 RepID=UPI0008945442|nr:hypothetical protein [Oribacterium sp. KHPX15]SEA97176.1 hypothetical protein SAMN05216349_1783 [Oribacterium sp. KHPX15]